jgi:hypothetical protein
MDGLAALGPHRDRLDMGLGSIRVSTPARRDRLWLLNAPAIALLTLLGATEKHLVTIAL